MIYLHYSKVHYQDNSPQNDNHLKILKKKVTLKDIAKLYLTKNQSQINKT